MVGVLAESVKGNRFDPRSGQAKRNNIFYEENSLYNKKRPAADPLSVFLRVALLSIVLLFYCCWGFFEGCFWNDFYRAS
jgi:hypothetical protein